MPPLPLPANFWHSADSCGLSPEAPLHLAPPGHILVKSSGTEGEPKWIALAKQAFLVSAEAVNAHLASTPAAADRWLVALPLHHVGGFSILARAFLSQAEVHFLEGKWDAPAFTQACAQRRISLTSLVPTQVYDLVQARLHAPNSLRAIIVGGGGLAQEIGQRARELGWPVLQSYGMTETASQVATATLGSLDSTFTPDAMTVLPIWQASTDDADVLSLSGPALASGVITNTAPDKLAWLPLDPPLRTRDRVALGHDGRRQILRFLGRESQMLKILGELVSLPALQTKLETLAARQGVLGRCAIVPLADARRGQVLVLAHEGDGAPLLPLFNARVQPFERLDRAVTVTHVPITDLGKVRLADLRKLVE